MTLGRFLVGIPLAFVAFVPIAFAAVELRRRWFLGWTGLEARLVEVVVGLTFVTVVGEVLGTVGWFALVPITVGLAATGSLGVVLARSGGSP